MHPPAAIPPFTKKYVYTRFRLTNFHLRGCTVAHIQSICLINSIASTRNTIRLLSGDLSKFYLTYIILYDNSLR